MRILLHSLVLGNLKGKDILHVAFLPNSCNKHMALLGTALEGRIQESWGDIVSSWSVNWGRISNQVLKGRKFAAHLQNQKLRGQVTRGRDRSKEDFPGWVRMRGHINSHFPTFSPTATLLENQHLWDTGCSGWEWFGARIPFQLKPYRSLGHYNSCILSPLSISILLSTHDTTMVVASTIEGTWLSPQLLSFQPSCYQTRQGQL